MTKKIRLIDLFAGCGGLSDGFEQTNEYHTIACVEWEKDPCRTLIKRLKEKWGYRNANDIVLNFDIQRTNELFSGWEGDPIFGSSEGLNSLVEKEGPVDLVIGGPPCQAYSLAGRIRDENGMNDDYRNYLFESYVKVVKKYKPKAFVFENVPGILSATPGGLPIIKRIAKAFEKIGYSISNDLRKYALIDCTKFGVPQARKRVIILGVNNSLINENPQIALYDFYKHIFIKHQSEKIETVKSAINDLPVLLPLKKPIINNRKRYSHCFNGHKVPNHEPRMHSERDIKTFEMLSRDIETGENRYISIESIKNLYYEITGKKSKIHKYYVLRWDKPSNTIPAHLYKDGLRHIHPDPIQARSITVREAARLQSFDDDFVFLGSATEQYKMVGNAVPPKFAKAIALSVKEFIEKYF